MVSVHMRVQAWVKMRVVSVSIHTCKYLGACILNTNMYIFLLCMHMRIAIHLIPVLWPCALSHVIDADLACVQRGGLFVILRRAVAGDGGGVGRRRHGEVGNFFK